MKPSKQQKATIQDVEREASRYIVYELGDCLWAGDPAYDERREQWTVPIHAQSLSPDVALGYVILDVARH